MNVNDILFLLTGWITKRSMYTYIFIYTYIYIFILYNYAFHASLTFDISAAIVVGDPFVHLLA